MARIIISTATTVIRTILPGERFEDGQGRHIDTKVVFRSDNYNHGSAWRDGAQLYDGLAGKAYDAYEAEVERLLSIDPAKFVPGARQVIIEDGRQ